MIEEDLPTMRAKVHEAFVRRAEVGRPVFVCYHCLRVGGFFWEGFGGPPRVEDSCPPKGWFVLTEWLAECNRCASPLKKLAEAAE